MYTVKIGGIGMILFRGKEVRVPAEFKKVSDKEIKYLKVVARRLNTTMEIMEKESERLASVAEKLSESDAQLGDIEIDETETKIEDLFESDDSLGTLLNNLKKDDE